MKAGTLRHRVVLQRLTETRGPTGDLVKTWADQPEIWAAVEPLSGREYWQAQQVAAETTIRVRIRYSSGVVPTMRVKYGTRTFEVLSIIDPEERHVELHLMCRELF